MKPKYCGYREFCEYREYREYRVYGAYRALFLALFVVVSCLLIPPSAKASETGSDLLSQARRAIETRHYAVAESLLQRRLISNPADANAQFMLARVYAWQKKYQRAITTYNQLLRLYPDHADYLLGKARTLVWSQQPRPALDLLAKARTVAPDYEAVWQLELQILSRLKDPASQQRYQRLRELALQRFPDGDWPAAQPAVATMDEQRHSTDLEINTRYDDLSDNLPSWHSYFITFHHKTTRGNAFYGKLRVTNRFDLNDRELSAGQYYALNPHWVAKGAAGISDTHRVLPHWFAHISAERRLSGGWNSQAGLRYRHYEFVDTRTLNVSIEKYWRAYRARYTLYMTSIDGDSIASQTEPTHSLAIAYYYKNSNFVGLSAATGKELEYDGSANALVSDIRNVALNGRQWIAADKWAINYLLEYQEQGTFYSRYGLRIGLLCRF